MMGVCILRLVHVRNRIWQRTIVTQTAGEYERHARLYAFVHDAALEAARFDGLLDTSGMINRIDGPHVIAMAVLFLPAIGLADAERRTEQRIFDIMNAERVATQKRVHITAANQLG